MKKASFSVIVLFFFCFSFTHSYAQDVQVYGTITAFGELPVANFPVVSKKAKTMVETDSLGQFSIVCKKKDFLLFDHKPFSPVRKKISGPDTINVNLVYIESKKSQYMVLENKFMSQKDLAYAVNELQDRNNNFHTYKNIFDLLKGQFSNLEISGGQIYIRGQSSSLTLNTSALLIVDGREVNDISNIQPLNVKSVQLLKGTEAAIYGSRGANGVIEIRLK